jgi:hypothetical protein
MTTPQQSTMFDGAQGQGSATDSAGLLPLPLPRAVFMDSYPARYGSQANISILSTADIANRYLRKFSA